MLGIPTGGDQQARLRQVLWLTAFVLLIRTALDPADNVYYNLPLVICLLCLEADRFPTMTIAASAGALLVVPTNRILPVGPDAQAALYAVVAIPALLALARCAYAGSAARTSWASTATPGIRALRTPSQPAPPPMSEAPRDLM